MSPTDVPAAPGPLTLCVDVGGTGIKASVVDPAGTMRHERVRVDTPYPLKPQGLVGIVADLTRGLPAYDRVSVGFPGMVRSGRILSAPHFVSPKGPGGKVSAALLATWSGYELERSIATALGRPTRVANDADVQGAALVRGQGLEMVITLGTGVGTALFWHGKLAPHLELAQHPLRKDKTYNQVLGEAARVKAGTSKWNRRLSEALEVLRDLVLFDHCFVGGGNAARVRITLPSNVSLAGNVAGILGGIRLWDRAD